MNITPEGPIQEEEALGKAYDAKLMRRLLRYLRPYRLHVVAAIFMLVLASGLELVGPWFTKIVIDQAIPADDYGLITRIGLIFLGALLLSAMLGYARTMLTTWIGQRVMLDLRRHSRCVFVHVRRSAI